MNHLQKLRDLKGFTLVELIIVIMIIGILAATLLPKVMGAPAKARDAARQADFNAIATAVEMYFADNEEFPDSVSLSDAVTAGLADQNADGDTGISDLLVGEGYLKNVLQDPVDTAIGTATYVYVYCTASVRGVAQQAYAITTRLETATGSAQNIKVGTAVIAVAPAASSGAALSDYEVTAGAGSDYGNSECLIF